jgi:hypothetical protein
MTWSALIVMTRMRARHGRVTTMCARIVIGHL